MIIFRAREGSKKAAEVQERYVDLVKAHGFSAEVFGDELESPTAGAETLFAAER